MALTLTIEVTGDTYSDVEQALVELTRLVPEGYKSGADSNDTGSYRFVVTGEEEEEYDDDDDDETTWDRPMHEHEAEYNQSLNS